MKSITFRVSLVTRCLTALALLGAVLICPQTNAEAQVTAQAIDKSSGRNVVDALRVGIQKALIKFRASQTDDSSGKKKKKKKRKKRKKKKKSKKRSAKLLNSRLGEAQIPDSLTVNCPNGGTAVLDGTFTTDDKQPPMMITFDGIATFNDCNGEVSGTVDVNAISDYAKKSATLTTSIDGDIIVSDACPLNLGNPVFGGNVTIEGVFNPTDLKEIEATGSVSGTLTASCATVKIGECTWNDVAFTDKDGLEAGCSLSL